MWQRVTACFRQKLTRFRKSDDGVTAVEFAFVGGPFIYLLMVIFETGLMLFAEYVVENGTANAARMIRTGEVQTQGVTAADFKTTVCGNLGSFLDCDSRLYVDVRKFSDFDSVSIPAGVGADGELSSEITTGSQFEPGSALEVVVVRVYYDWKLFTPGLSKLSNLADGRRLLTAGAAFRNEPFGS